MDIIVYIGVAFSMIGTFANVRKKWWCFVFWFVANALLAAHNWEKSDWSQFVLFLFFEVMCIYGVWLWLKEKK